MTEPIEWLPDGTPYSPRFGDRYHSENGGLTQARRVFLHGCGLPEAWAGQPQWRILETGFGFGLNFLVTWAAWRADLQRPTLLHFVSTEAWPVSAGDLLRATSVHPELAPLAEALHRQWWGLLPGVHRLRFDEGRVLLTLYVGDTQAMLRQQNLTVDSIYLDGFSPQRNPESWDLHTLKAVARSCRRGTQLATWTIARAVRDGLAQCGFEVNRVPGVPPKRDNLHATYNPRWEPRTTRQPVAAPEPALPGPCIVTGGGTAGAGAAWSEPAPPATLAAAQLPPDATACWHHQAGWVRPARLATALLAQPGIRWQGGCQVAQLRHTEPPAADDHPATTAWQALDAPGPGLAGAPPGGIAAGAGRPERLHHPWPLQPG